VSRRSTTLIKAALSALHYSGADRLAAPLTAGNGVIFMLHHVTPAPVPEFAPNRILAITPEFLDEVITLVLRAGFEPIAMDALPERLASPGTRPFACFTFDDGYRDNRDHALPVFRKHAVPFTIYVPSSFADGEGDLWWLNLETALRRLDAIRIELNGEQLTFQTRTAAQKSQVFHSVYWTLRSMAERQARAIVSRLCAEAGIDPRSACRELAMGWDELRALDRDPLVSIGAHTCRHLALAKLDAGEAEREINDSVSRIEAELGRPCRHFSYPYGDEGSAGPREFALTRAAGIATAVTTRKGLIRPRHAAQLTGLPRLSLNGDYQQTRYVRALLSGLPFAMRDAVNRVRRSAA
jgi:peptidoglycan/xylan/chitin deacetylase (PgdA/CDA1 family)